MYESVMYKSKNKYITRRNLQSIPRPRYFYRMECIASTSTDEERVIQRNQGVTSTVKDVKETSGVFRCFNCLLEERFDFKGTKPPFARQLNYSEECYIMKDPFSLPNKGEVLVLGADCQFCKKPVCLGCSVYFGKRFCLKCASNNIQNLPSQLHPKIKSLMKSTDSQK